MPTETPAPRAGRRRRAEEPDVVHQRVAASRALERRGEPLELVEHVLEPDDRRGRDVSGRRQPAGHQAVQQSMLRAASSPRASDRRGRSACRTSVDARRRPGTATGARLRCASSSESISRAASSAIVAATRVRAGVVVSSISRPHSPGPCKPKISSGSPARQVPSTCDRCPIARVRACRLRPTRVGRAPTLPAPRPDHRHAPTEHRAASTHPPRPWPCRPLRAVGRRRRHRRSDNRGQTPCAARRDRAPPARTDRSTASTTSAIGEGRRAAATRAPRRCARLATPRAAPTPRAGCRWRRAADHRDPRPAGSCDTRRC